ncbi:MAG: hypothetical protein CSA11_01085 [Chloroflexi bacterium]|nr:MAG: hypothetical protein CSA11_01085 [Chloroflexota bacterium]
MAQSHPFFVCAMIRWLKRFLIAIFLLVWFVVLLFPCMAFNLAMRTEMHIGRNVRVFLVSEEIGEGIGVEWKRPFTTPDLSCTQTAVNYFMWAGSPENVTYCQCTDPTTGETLPSTPTSCPP